MRTNAPPLIVVVSLTAACAFDPGPREIGAASYASEVCASGATVRGIDVSAWQESIDWAAVAGDGIQFAFIRASHGLDGGDDFFAANWAGAREHGIVRGAYQYFTPSADTLAQADLLLQVMGPLQPGDLPPVIDVEETGGLAPDALTAEVRVWIDHVQGRIGRAPLIYTGKYFWEESVRSSAFAAQPLWVAQWGVACPDLPAPWGDWSFQQTSAHGSVAGIDGDVDLDLFNGTAADLGAFGGADCSDCPRCEPIPPSGRTIEDEDPCFQLGGTASSIRAVDGEGWEGDLAWTYATDWQEVDNFASWTLELEEKGRYLVEVYTAAPWAQSRRAAYEIRHGGAVDRIPVDQTAVDGWTSLGEVDFGAGGDQWVRLGDNTGEPLGQHTQLVFDALRLRPLGATASPSDDPGAGMGSGEQGQGCGCRLAGHRPPAPFALLLILAAALTCSRRSRRAGRSRIEP